MSGRAPTDSCDTFKRKILYTLGEAKVLVEQCRREYNTIRPHSALGYVPPAPEAIWPSPEFLNMPWLQGPPQAPGVASGLT